jgi:toxin FitB
VTYLVDANVFSEPTRPQPSPRVIQWLAEHESELTIDPIILGEIRFGIELLPTGARRRRLEQWFSHGIQRIHCIPFEAGTGLRWAKLIADLRRAGHSMPIKDSLIAATALTHNLIVATRNTPDFATAKVKLVDPFV